MLITGWVGDERWKDVAHAFAKEALTALNSGDWGREQDWDTFVAALQKARQQGAPWEALQVPRGDFELHHGLKRKILKGMHWGLDQQQLLAGYEWPLELTLAQSPKTARALIELGAPLNTLFAGWLKLPNAELNLSVAPFAIQMPTLFGAPEHHFMRRFKRAEEQKENENEKRDPLLRADWTFVPWTAQAVLDDCLLMVRQQKVNLPKQRGQVKPNWPLLSVAIQALGKQVEAPQRRAMAKKVLETFRVEKEGLWLNKEGCAPGEAEAAKAVFWAQETAAGLADLNEVDAQWAKDAAKIKAKSRAAGKKNGSTGKGSKGAQSSVVSQEQLSRWSVIGMALNNDDQAVWMALEALAGVDNAASLNEPMGKTYRPQNHLTKSLFISHSLLLGAHKIAARMLDQGANPWLLPAELLGANSRDRKSPLAALGVAIETTEKEKRPTSDSALATLGRAFVEALLRDAQLQEPSEEQARALVRDELNAHLSAPGLPSAIKSAMEQWSLSVELGLEGAMSTKDSKPEQRTTPPSGSRSNRRL